MTTTADADQSDDLPAIESIEEALRFFRSSMSSTHANFLFRGESRAFPSLKPRILRPDLVAAASHWADPHRSASLEAALLVRFRDDGYQYGSLRDQNLTHYDPLCYALAQH